jgi:hypothetical protein
MSEFIMLIILLIVAIAIPIGSILLLRKSENENILTLAVCTLISIVLFFIAVETRLYDPLSIVKKTSWSIPMIFVVVKGIIGLWKGKHVVLVITLMVTTLIFPVLYLLYSY